MHTIAGDNNTPDGPVKEFIKDILSRDTIDGIDYSTLDDIVYKAAFDKLSKDEYKQLVAALLLIKEYNVQLIIIMLEMLKI